MPATAAPGPATRSSEVPGSPSLRFRLGAVAILLIAFVLRATRWTEGLPAFLDEAQPLRIALRMWREEGVVDWNPHFFVYPSLAIYLHFAVQWLHFAAGGLLGVYPGLADFLLGFITDPTRHVVLGRAAATGLDLVAILGTVVLGERLRPGAGLAAGCVVAVSPNGIDTSRALYVEAPLMAATVWAVERMVVHLRRGNVASLAAAALLVGLAASCKYPGVLLAIPLACAAWWGAPQGGAPRLGRFALAGGLAASTFAITSPYVLLDWGRASEDLRFATDLARRGHLGHLERAAAGFYARTLARDPGAIVGALAAALPAIAWRDAARRRDVWLLVLAIVPVLASISVSSVIAARYLVPVVPLIAVAGAVAAFALVRRIPRVSAPMGAAIAAAVVIGSVVPAAWSQWTLPSRDTRLEALAWARDSLPQHAVVLQESGGPPLLPVTRKEAVQESAVFLEASTAARARHRALRDFNVVVWPLFVHGDLSANLAEPGAPPRWVEVVREASDFNGAFYDLALVAHADYVITSSVVRSRYEADSVRFAAQVRLYRALDREAEMIARFAPERGLGGPEVRVYRVSPATRAQWQARRGDLDPHWWLGFVSRDAAIRDENRGGTAIAPDGRPAWSLSLGGFHARHVEPTLGLLAQAVARAGRPADAAPLVRARDAWRLNRSGPRGL